MKEIFDWLREQMEKNARHIGIRGEDGHHNVVGLCTTYDIINEAEAKWKEKEAELRANVIDEFKEKAFEMFTDFSMNHDFMSLGNCETILYEIASQMKGEKE